MPFRLPTTSHCPPANPEEPDPCILCPVPLTFVVSSKRLLLPATPTDRCPCLNSLNLAPSRVSVTTCPT